MKGIIGHKRRLKSKYNWKDVNRLRHETERVVHKNAERLLKLVNDASPRIKNNSDLNRELVATFNTYKKAVEVIKSTYDEHKKYTGKIDMNSEDYFKYLKYGEKYYGINRSVLTVSNHAATEVLTAIAENTEDAKEKENIEIMKEMIQENQESLDLMKEHFESPLDENEDMKSYSPDDILKEKGDEDGKQ